MSVEIRQACEEDVEPIADLWMEMMGEHRDFEPRLRLSNIARGAYENYLSLQLRSPLSNVLLATEGDTIQAFACAYIAQNLPMFLPSDLGYISDVYVVPHCRKAGLGKRLIAHLHDWFSGQGIKVSQLQVYRQNEKAIGFWAEMGYEPFFDRMWHDLETTDKD
jgi:diamine N-acetyltransferase